MRGAWTAAGRAVALALRRPRAHSTAMAKDPKQRSSRAPIRTGAAILWRLSGRTGLFNSLMILGRNPKLWNGSLRNRTTGLASIQSQRSRHWPYGSSVCRSLTSSGSKASPCKAPEVAPASTIHLCAISIRAARAPGSVALPASLKHSAAEARYSSERSPGTRVNALWRLCAPRLKPKLRQSHGPDRPLLPRCRDRNRLCPHPCCDYRFIIWAKIR
jgi:hypothetical protein